MKTGQSTAKVLYKRAGVSAASLIVAGLALSQQALSAASEDELETIVITATRFAQSADKVPMSVSAVSQDDLVNKGVTNVRDLARVVPGLTLRVAGAGTDTPAVSNVAIRGVYGTSGAATTGVYLNDTPLQRRFTTSGFQINGTPTPPLFDVERVEVLRGPQGTLYGGSSLGGTLRFITPSPSLTHYTAYARAEGNHTQYGGNGYEIGAAGGGPIAENRLGFRVSAYTRRDAGYIDRVDPFSGGALRAENVNSTQTTAFQVALKAAFTDHLSGTLAWYKSRVDADDASGFYNLPVSGNSVTTRPPSLVLPPLPGSTGYTLNNLSYLSKPFQTFTVYSSPNTTQLMVPSLTFLYEGEGYNLQSSTSYVDDDSLSPRQYDTTFVGLQNGVTSGPGGVTTSTGIPYSPLVSVNPVSPSVGTNLVPFWTHTYRTGWTEELRYTTSGDGPVAVVAGLYGAKFKLITDAYQMGTFDSYFLPTVGALPPIFGPVFNAATPIGYGPVAAGQTNNVEDDEIAAYGEATWHVAPKWNLIGGLRVSWVKTTYSAIAEGQLLRTPQATGPTVANGGVSGGSQENKPFTPKLEVQYNFTENRMVYALAAKAFRPGGANQAPIPGVCRALGSNRLAGGVGVELSDVPRSYAPDTVWSYEIGAKMRVTPNMQWNASVYRIDWSNIQAANGLPACGQAPTVNAGKAISQGFDTDLNAAFGGLTASVSVGYDDAYYAQDALGPAPSDPGFSRFVILQKGDRIPVPVWTSAVGLSYSFNLANGNKLYVRGDYQFTGSYENSPRAGSAGYQPDTRITPSGHVTNVRVGTNMGAFDLSLFANNIFNDRPHLAYSAQSGRTSCTAGGAACTAYATYNPFYLAATYRPLTFGVTVVYRLK